MYDPALTSKAVERAGIVRGIIPEYHSVEQVQRNNKHFADLLHPETGELVRKLFPDEEAWVLNEWTICQADASYTWTRYCKILGWDGRLVLFDPNIAQKITLDVWAEAERDGVAVAEQALKARQLGKTTIGELNVGWRVQFYPNVTAIVASADPEKSAKMLQIVERAWRHMPWFLMPKITAYARGEYIEFGELGSTLTVQHGAKITGVARGQNPIVFHGAEMAEWENPEDLIDASLIPAMHESPFMWLLLEGTGKRRHDWWHKKWEYSKANWRNGRSLLRPTFLPWYIGRDIYPTETWLRGRLSHVERATDSATPKDWKPESLTVAHAERAQDYVSKNDLLRKYLGEDWRMPLEQMWFWELTRLEYKANGSLGKFYAEYASDDTEAFQAQSVSIIDPDLICFYREHTKQPIGVFGLTGPSSLIHPRLQPHKREINPNLPPLKIDQDFTLVPLLFAGTSEECAIGKVMLWEFPEQEEEYGLGVDPGMGIGQDRSVIEAIRKGTRRRADAQVAEFASPWLNAKDLVPFCYAIGRFFSTRRGGSIRQARIVTEIEGGGNITQLDLRLKFGWRNFHTWMRAYDQVNLDRSRSRQLGWSTNRWSRPQLLITFMDYLRNLWLEVNSPWLCDEMADLEADENTQKIKARAGAHDDRVMATAMVLFSLHDLEIWKRDQPIAAMREQSMDESETAPIWRPGLQGTDRRTLGPAVRRALLVGGSPDYPEEFELEE
jgi:hypothetical protein